MVSCYSLLKKQLWLLHNGFCRAAALVGVMAFITQFVPNVTGLYTRVLECGRARWGVIKGHGFRLSTIRDVLWCRSEMVSILNPSWLRSNQHELDLTVWRITIRMDPHSTPSILPKTICSHIATGTSAAADGWRTNISRTWRWSNSACYPCV